MRRLGLATGTALAIAGLGLLGAGLWMPAKAVLGQALLSRAWEAAAGVATPWPWADIRPVARLSAPRLGVSAVVLGSASGEAMAWGPGHIAGTAAPGGEGLSGIAGHRDSHLAFLAGLRPGDRLEIETPDGAVSAYRVTGARVVDSRHWRLPVRLDGRPALALSTCWPLDGTGDGPLRFVLFAEATTLPGA